MPCEDGILTAERYEAFMKEYMEILDRLEDEDRLHYSEDGICDNREALFITRLRIKEKSVNKKSVL
jgi:hypothetical protein